MMSAIKLTNGNGLLFGGSFSHVSYEVLSYLIMCECIKYYRSAVYKLSPFLLKSL